MDVQELDSYSPSVDVIAMVMMASMLRGISPEFLHLDIQNYADLSYELADALVEKRKSRLRDKESDHAK